MSEIKCPRCGSEKIDQFRMPTGAIWWSACGFRIEQKERGNPFIRAIDEPKIKLTRAELIAIAAESRGVTPEQIVVEE